MRFTGESVPTDNGMAGVKSIVKYGRFSIGLRWHKVTRVVPDDGNGLTDRAQSHAQVLSIVRQFFPFQSG